MLRWLHISDLHIKADNTFEQNIVFDSLIESFDNGGRFSHLKPDVIFCTGDIAYSAKGEEYNLASIFFSKLCKITKVTPCNVYIIPGNHDLTRITDKSEDEKLSIALKDKKNLLHDDLYFKILFNQFYNFSSFQCEIFSRPITLYKPYLSSYSSINRYNLEIIGLNTAWLASFKKGKNELIIGEKILRNAIAEIEKSRNGYIPDLKIGLIHHPVEWLTHKERTEILPILIESCDIILYGHMHSNDPYVITKPYGTTAFLGTGATYQDRRKMNAAMIVEFVPKTSELVLYPICFNNTGKGYWIEDNSVFFGKWPGRIELDKHTPKDCMRHPSTSKPSTDVKILVADDKKNNTSAISNILRQYGFDNIHLLNKIENLSEFDDFDLVICDIVWPKGKRPKSFSSCYFGIDVMQYLRKNQHDTAIVLMSENTFDLECIKDICDADLYFKTNTSPSDIIDKILMLLSSKSKFAKDNSKAELWTWLCPFPISNENSTNNLLRLLSLLRFTLDDATPKDFNIDTSSYAAIRQKLKNLMCKQIIHGTFQKDYAINELQAISNFFKDYIGVGDLILQCIETINSLKGTNYE